MPERGALFEHIAPTELEDSPIDYLEFGVYRGASILWWADRNRHPDSRFFGFDSFEGLPESWELGIGGLNKGASAYARGCRPIGSAQRSFKNMAIALT